MAKKFDVIGIGNAITDIQFQVPDELLAEFELTKGGMTLVELSQQQKLLERVAEYNGNQASGGSAANTMIALAQLGGHGVFAGVVADDEFGNFYANEMKDLGLVFPVAPISSGVTGTCLILITPDAERTMNTYLGASAEFGPEHIAEDHLTQAQWLYIEGYLFSSPSGRVAVEKAISLANANGVKIAITFSDAFIVNGFGDDLRRAVESAELVFANLTEAQAFTGEEDEKRVFEQMKDVVPNFVVTLHDRGAMGHFEGEEYFFDPYPVKAVDETGAGDMFAGGLLYALSNGYPPAAAGKLASYLASRVVAQLGPRLPSILKQGLPSVAGSGSDAEIAAVVSQILSPESLRSAG